MRAVRACHRRARVARHLRAALALRPLDLELGASDQARSLPCRSRALHQALSRHRQRRRHPTKFHRYNAAANPKTLGLK